MKMEQRRGHVLTCRRGKEGCRCVPRCSERPVGYDDEMVPCYEMATIREDLLRVDFTASDYWHSFTGTHKDDALTDYEGRCHMLVTGLCADFWSPILANRLAATLGVNYNRTRVLLKYCRHCREEGKKSNGFAELGKHFSLFCYEEVVFLKKLYLFLSFAVKELFSDSDPGWVDVCALIKRYAIWLSNTYIEELLSPQKQQPNTPSPVTWYWYDAARNGAFDRIGPMFLDSRK